MTYSYGMFRVVGWARRPIRWKLYSLRHMVALTTLAWTLGSVPSGSLAAQVVTVPADVPLVVTAPARLGSGTVIPFVNISGEPADDWVGSGIAETVTADLQALGVLPVMGREAFLKAVRGRYPNLSTLDERVALQVAHALGMSWFISGGYQRLGELVRVTARILEVPTGTVVDTVKVDGTLSALFALQDRVVDELSKSLKGRIVASKSARPSFPPGGSREEFVLDTEVSDMNLGLPSRPASLVPKGVTGDLAIGVASEAGILTGRPTVRAARTADPPDIDGRLDDLVWRTAARITDFVQQRPLDGDPASEHTEVYVAYDNQNLYFGLYAHYSDFGFVRANRVDRDQAFRDDTISFYFDTFLDQQRAYIFSVNGYGVQGDAITGALGGGGGGRGRSSGSHGSRSGGGTVAPGGDPSWDALFASAGTLVEDGWTAEVAIPFKSLRYPQRGRNEEHRWGFQIVRTIKSKDESDVWSPISRDMAGFLSQMGVLEGLTGLSMSRNIEIMPTFTAIQAGTRDTATGAFANHYAAPEGGVNFKYGITSNLTLDFTYNPDFSQIETDTPQIEVNQRFPLFFPELRPFFLEGAEIFRVSSRVNAVHTRTLVDPKYGAKLTGKVGNMALGFLVANDEAPGKVDDPTDSAYGKAAQVFIGRFRYDLYPESYLGVIMTNREFLDSSSRLGGVDGNFRLGQTHNLGVRAVTTDRRGDDGARRSGSMFDIGLRHRGRNLSYNVAYFETGPGYRPDTGFVRRVDIRETFTSGNYRWWPENWIVNWGPRFRYARNYDFDGVRQDEQMGAGLSFAFAKNIRLDAGYDRDVERFGDIDFWKSRYSVGGGVDTSRRLSVGGFVRWGDQIQFSNNPFLGSGSNAALFVTLRPFSRLQSEITMNASRLVDPRSATEMFDVEIWRAFTTYQFTDRLLLRNIMEYNTFDRKLLGNVLFTYRVNAGTVFFVGYDARYDDGSRFDELLFTSSRLIRTNHAFFTKLQYLFRY